MEAGRPTVVALNLTEAAVDASLGGGEVLLSTHRDREGERVAIRCGSQPWEALIVSQHQTD